MTDLYLIAHKVSGEPAFDIAMRMECPECKGKGHLYFIEGDDTTCTECDSLGFWWIIPTSGHRAYPWWNSPLSDMWHDKGLSPHEVVAEPLDACVPEMPLTLPDHYHHTASPSEVRDRLAALLASLPPAPKVAFKRRF